MMLINSLSQNIVKTAILALILSGCGNNTTSTDTATNNQTSPTETTANSSEKLKLVANGEDFIRQGFVSKDGWRIDFNHAYVTLNNVTAYQTSPPFNALEDEDLQITESVTLVNSPTTIDLAEGDASAEPILVTETSAPEGFYNAIAWQVIENPDTEGGIILDGVAEKDGEKVDFVLNLPVNLSYTCGEFVGDNRKGILEANQSAEVEVTFHFDHIFGDADTPSDDALNVDAIGFEPLKSVASDGKLESNLGELKSELSTEDYQKLEKSLVSLGHVGEGHCRIN